MADPENPFRRSQKPFRGGPNDLRWNAKGTLGEFPINIIIIKFIRFAKFREVTKYICMIILTLFISKQGPFSNKIIWGEIGHWSTSPQNSGKLHPTLLNN